MIPVDSLKPGDRMRFSTELMEMFENDPAHCSQLVEVVEIKEDVLDGTKIVYLANVRQTCESH